MPVALQDNSFIIPVNSTEKIYTKSTQQNKLSRHKYFKNNEKIFIETPQHKNNFIDFSKYTTKRNDLNGEEPSASNNYGYLKLPELTHEDYAKLSQKTQKGGKMNEHLKRFFNPTKKNDPNNKLSSSHVINLLSNLRNFIPIGLNVIIFYDEEPNPTENSYNINGTNYLFSLFFYDEINESPENYHHLIENLNGMVDFEKTKQQNEVKIVELKLNSYNVIKIYDDDDNEYVFDAYYRQGNLLICAEELITIALYDEIMLVKWNPKLFLPKNTTFKTDYELSTFFTEYPKGSEFKLIEITENDKNMIKCYTHSWDFYMNDELWSNSSNVDLNKIDLNKLNTGLDSNLLNDPTINVAAESHLTELKNNKLIPFGLSFPVNEYNIDKLAYIRKESKYKNEYYHNLMTMKTNSVDIDTYGNTAGIFYHENRYDKLHIYRGMTQPFDLNRPGLTVNNGNFVNKGFLSTSINLNIAKRFAIKGNSPNKCIYQFTVMPGVPYISYDNNPFSSVYLGEGEVLIGNNAIINVEKVPYNYYEGIPIIKGTISYDNNYMLHMNLKHSKKLIYISTSSNLDLYDLSNFSNEQNIFKWTFLQNNLGGKKTRKRRKRKSKKRKHRRHNKY